MSTASAPAQVSRDFVDAFSAADFDAMRALLADDLVAWITDAAGASEEVRGREALLARLEAMDLPAARFSVTLTQEPVEVDAERVLIMVEVRAQKGESTLHNFAAHLLRVSDGAVSEWRMVDAKPAESDRFWS